MTNFKKIKENFVYDWKRRKYNLSLFGKNSQTDWNVVLLFILFMLIVSAIGGSVNYVRINNEINRETEEVFFKSRKKDIEKVGTLVTGLKERREKFNLEVDGKAN